MNIPTAHSSESLERFIEHIQKTLPPKQVSRIYLQENGFKSGNDPELRHIARLLGFLDDSDTPLPIWDKFNDEGIEVLREAIEKCYSGLFELYEKPYLESDEVLAQWFKPPVTGKTSSARERAIRTFRKLCMVAGYDMSKPATERVKTKNLLNEGNLSVGKSNVVFQLHPDMTYQNYHDLFKALQDSNTKGGD